MRNIPSDPSYEKRSISLRMGTIEGSPHIGSCIYCGETNDLRNEHTIPLALWGTQILRSASCGSCAEATSRFERAVLREGGLGRAREFLNAPTRHSKRRGLRTGFIQMQSDSGDTLSAPLGATPQFALLPIFNYLPRGISLESKSNKHRTLDVAVCMITAQQDPKFSGYWGPEFKINSTDWCRFISKILYSEYIRTVDNSFRSKSVSKYIITGSGDHTKIIGGRPKAPTVPYIYNINFCAIPQNKGSYSLIGYLRILSFIESPSYLMHLGIYKTKGELPQNLFVNANWTADNIWPKYPDMPIVWESEIFG